MRCSLTLEPWLLFLSYKVLKYHLNACFTVYSTGVLFSETGQQTKTKNGRKNDPNLEEIEAKFQRDPFKGFGHKDIYHICNRWLEESAAVDQEKALNPTYRGAGRHHVGPCPKFLLLIFFLFSIWHINHTASRTRHRAGDVRFPATNTTRRQRKTAYDHV